MLWLTPGRSTGTVGRKVSDPSAEESESVGGTLVHPIVNITVEDISAAEQAIERNGGRVLQRKRPIGDGTMGWTGYFIDSEGNTLGRYQMPKTRITDQADSA